LKQIKRAIMFKRT